MPFRLPPPVIRTLFILALIAIFILAMIPMAVVPEVVDFQDKLHHSAAFAVLMLLGWAGWPARINAVAGGLLGYGILIEICQHTLTTNRFGEPMDVVADVLGIVIARWIIQARTARPA
jgi:VanZ family protein